MEEQLKAVFSRYVRQHKGGMAIGRDGVRVRMFLDLLSAAHDPEDLTLLATALAEAIGSDDDLSSCDGIVGLKQGNCILAKEVAARLKKKTSFIRQGILFGNWIEGPIRSGHKVMLVDDVGSDREPLILAVENLRHAGVYVKKAWVLVDRSEFSLQRPLSDLGIEYRGVYRLSDDDLTSLAEHRHKRV